MTVTTRIVIGAAAAAALVSSGQLVAAAAPTNTDPAEPKAGLRSVTYLARVDGFVEGGQATFRVSDTETSTAELTAVGFGPGQSFEAQAALADLSKAGMRVSIPAPYSANVLCEIRVDETSISHIERFIAPPSDDGGPAGGVVTCGAALPAEATGAS